MRYPSFVEKGNTIGFMHHRLAVRVNRIILPFKTV